MYQGPHSHLRKMNVINVNTGYITSFVLNYLYLGPLIKKASIKGLKVSCSANIIRISAWSNLILHTLLIKAMHYSRRGFLDVLSVIILNISSIYNNIILLGSSINHMVKFLGIFSIPLSYWPLLLNKAINVIKWWFGSPPPSSAVHVVYRSPFCYVEHKLKLYKTNSAFILASENKSW